VLHHPMIRVVRRNLRNAADVARELALAGGGNRSASRITARVGWSRLDWIGREMGRPREGGKLLRRSRRSASRTKVRAPQSLAQSSRWVHPESYGSPELVAARKQLKFKMGETFLRSDRISSRGDYEPLLHARRPRGEFVQLTPAVARQVARAIEAAAACLAPRREALRGSHGDARSGSMRPTRMKCCSENYGTTDAHR